MPLLEVCDTDGNLREDAVLNVFSVMLFPDKQGKRAEIIVDAVANLCVSKKLWASPTVVELIRHNPSPSVLKAEADKRYDTGTTVGLIYCYMLALSKVPGIGNRASFNTLATVAARVLGKAKQRTAERTLRKWWETMTPVRHLWAAWAARGAALNQFEFIDGEVASHSATDDLGCFLLEAMEALEQGNYRSPAANKSSAPLASPDSAFAMPPNWKKPQPLGPFGHFRLQEPPPELLRQIELLRAKEQSPRKPRKK
jgi:hypothetical protein